MYHIKSVPFVILSLLLLCTSCSKDDDPSPQGPGTEDDGYFMMATIDGNTFSTDNVGVNSEAGIEEDYFIIGTQDNGDWISLSIEGWPVTGAFSPATDNDNNLIYMSLQAGGVWGAENDMGTGVVNMTDVTDTYIQGTFSFTGAQPTSTETVHVAAGSFKAQRL